MKIITALSMPAAMLRAALLALLFLAAPGLRAEIIGVEQFDYPDGPIDGKSGGTFWDFGNLTTPVTPVHDGTPSLWTNDLGTPVVSGGRLVTDNTRALRPHNGPSLGFGVGSDEEKGSVTDGRLQQVVYHRVTFTTGATVPEFLGLSAYDFGTERIFFGKRFLQPVFGIETTNGFGTVNSTVSIAANNTYTLVSKVDYAANKLSLFINPTFGGTEPTPDAVITGYTTNNFSTRVRLASGVGGAVTWDNLLVATTWAEIGGTVVTTTADEDDGPTSLITPADISLREAVKYSPAGSLITFAPALNGQTCTLSLGEMVIDKALTIDASALANGVTIDANRTSRHFFIAGATASFTLKSLSLINGNGVGNSSNVGGAIYLFAGNLSLQRCTLSRNSAESAGAIWFQGSGTSHLEECTLTGNRATANFAAGGIVVIDGTCTLSRCTISGNTGGGAGGGLYLQSPGRISLSNCLIAGNSDSFANDIDKLSGTLTASGNNLIGSNATVESIFPQGPLVGTQSAPLNPKLSPLGNFGGPTQTMHPLIGSPAIDAGGTTDPGGTDQRGFPRFVDGDASGTAQLDIGAVEAGPLLTVTTEVDELDLFGSGAGFSLREALFVATAPGQHIAFSTSRFPRRIPLTLGELSIANGKSLFIDASNIGGVVALDAGNASRIFNIDAGTTVAMHSLAILNGRAPDGASAQAGANGGGNLSAGFLSLFSCSLQNNRSGNGGLGDPFNDGGAGGNGGGIFSTGSLSLNACTLSGNATGNGGAGGGGGGSGGGMVQSVATSSRLTACTIVGNRTGSGAAGFGVGGGVLGGNAILQHCLIAQNFGSGGGPDDVRVDSLTLLSSNLLTSATVTTTTGSASIINANPKLAPLGNYGGPTQTMPPLPGSPAINAAALNEVQQIDIGALPVTFTLSFNGQTTGSLTQSSTASQVQSALTGLSTIGSGNVSVTQSSSGLSILFIVTFTGTLASGDQPPITSAGGALTITTLQDGLFPRLTDQRGFPIVGLPDLGAAEYQGAPDLRQYWPTDWDGDGIPFGVEQALGTNPLAYDLTDTRNLAVPAQVALGGVNVSFGRNLNAAPGTVWILKRSIDLETFTEIFRFNGITSSSSVPGITYVVGASLISVVDQTPPQPKAFYRFEAISP